MAVPATSLIAAVPAQAHCTQRDLAFNVMDQSKMGWTGYTKFGLRTSDGYIRSHPQPARELR